MLSTAVADNQPTIKYRMNQDLASFAARLREAIVAGDNAGSLTSGSERKNEPPHAGSDQIKFNELALELFALQFAHNSLYKKICEARRLTPQVVEHWTQIPFVPTSAFKELELTSLATARRTAVFHSSGTSEQKPSRHFHGAESLELYEASLWSWFRKNVLGNSKLKIQNFKLISLTPAMVEAPHSSLAHMFETVRRNMGATERAFFGRLDAGGQWTLDFDSAAAALSRQDADGLGSAPAPGAADRALAVGFDAGKGAPVSTVVIQEVWRGGAPNGSRGGCVPQIPDAKPRLLLGTAFSFVHLVDFLAEKKVQLQLPDGSRVMETGGYKNRSRHLPKTELHALISKYLGVPPENIVCEYGMSELSSQAYDSLREPPETIREGGDCSHPSPPIPPHEPGGPSPHPGPLPSHPMGAERESAFAKATADRWQADGGYRLNARQDAAGSGGQGANFSERVFHFPPWARVQIISPETGREVREGESGLIRIFDLANVFSVSAIQTEDFGVRRGDGFELIGRAKLSEPRGCSLMAI